MLSVVPLVKTISSVLARTKSATFFVSAHTRLLLLHPAYAQRDAHLHWKSCKNAEVHQAPAEVFESLHYYRDRSVACRAHSVSEWGILLSFLWVRSWFSSFYTRSTI